MPATRWTVQEPVSPLFTGRKGDLNIRAAFVHMAADAGVSLGVVGAGAAILYTGWLWLDPAISLAIVAVVVIGSWDLLRESVNLSMDAAPSGINPGEVRQFLLGLPGVEGVHDLHIWPMSTTEAALTVHLVIPDDSVDDRFLSRLAGELRSRFDIPHSTFQIERGECGACALR